MGSEMKQSDGKKRAAVCAALLLILAASAVCGIEDSASNDLMVPVMLVHTPAQATSLSDMDTIRKKLDDQREEEISMLDALIADPSANVQTADEAMKQKIEIVNRMEYEAQTVACLEHMGFTDCAALYGTQNMTVFIPFEYMGNEKNRTAIIDAVSALTGIGAESIKIILAKK